MRDDVRQAVFEIIAREAAIDEQRITLDASLKSLDIQSLDAVQIVFEIENHYGIQVPEQDPGFDTTTVRGLVDTVEKLLGSPR